MPYAAENIADFWRRWHISLSNWLRDYLYFSLPGLRSKWKIFTYFNLILTMLLGGLWHGASWNFVIWGLLHGVGLAVTRAWQARPAKQEARSRLATRSRAVSSPSISSAFAWIFFRSPTLEAALTCLEPHRLADGIFRQHLRAGGDGARDCDARALLSDEVAGLGRQTGSSRLRFMRRRWL